MYGHFISFCGLRTFHDSFIPSSVDEHLVCLHLLAIVSDAAVNIRMSGVVWVPIFISFGHIFITGIAGSYGNSIFNFFLCFWPHYLACRILVPPPGIKPAPPVLEVEIKHWPPGSSLYLSFWGTAKCFTVKVRENCFTILPAVQEGSDSSASLRLQKLH